MPPTGHSTSILFIELGAVVLGLALLARIASRWGFSAIPFYLLSGLVFGNGGLRPLNVSAGFIRTGAEIGVLLLLFMLGLEYTGDQLKENLRGGVPVGILDLVLNFTPGFVAGLLLHWRPLAAVLLGGITFISSSGVVAKVLAELHRLKYPETPVVLSVLVLEDLVMAVYLPLVAVLIVGGGPGKLALSVSLAVAVVFLSLVVAIKYGNALTHYVAHQSDEVILLTIFGLVLFLAGLAQQVQMSPAIAAFLIGIAVSGPMSERSHRLIAPLTDLFAAAFFFFFGLEIDPATLPPVLWVAVELGIVTSLTKMLTGYWAAQYTGVDRRGRFRAGMELVAHGEFSIVIAGLGAGIEPALGPLAAAYVLLLAILGPILSRSVK
jgi:monovalent cation:H+ antiporter-2, CPA2 family